jgi:hypothetical protein
MGRTKSRHTFFVILACLPLADFCKKTMILAYCITPQPQRGGPTAKQRHVRTVDGAIVIENFSQRS